jgi:hypothetical protein
VRKIGVMALVVTGAVAGGCAGDSRSGLTEPTPSENRGLLAIFSPKPKELTAKEGQKLLADIQKNPKRAEKLTPQEKRFIQKAVAVKMQNDRDEDEGRR